MAVVSMKQLLEAGVHFGHQTRRWNPKMRRYIFTQRNGIHIIDLQKTVVGLDRAYDYVRDLAATGEKLLFVGTKKQAQEAVKDEATRANQFYVNQRWLGGLLTNFKTIQDRLRRLDELERMKVTGQMELRPKKEQLRLGDEMAKLERLLGGIRTMRRLPAALFIVDCMKEHLAVHEASRLGIPIVALVDTNADPDPVAFPIPANDDAIRAVRLLAGRMADATVEGQQMRESMLAEQEQLAEAEAAAKAALEDESDQPTPSTDWGEPEIELAVDEAPALSDRADASENTETTSGPGASAAEEEYAPALEPASDLEAENGMPLHPLAVATHDGDEVTQEDAPMQPSLAITDERPPTAESTGEIELPAGEALAQFEAGGPLEPVPAFEGEAQDSSDDQPEADQAGKP